MGRNLLFEQQAPVLQSTYALVFQRHNAYQRHGPSYYMPHAEPDSRIRCGYVRLRTYSHDLDVHDDLG